MAINSLAIKAIGGCAAVAAVGITLFAVNTSASSRHASSSPASAARLNVITPAASTPNSSDALPIDGDAGNNSDAPAAIPSSIPTAAPTAAPTPVPTPAPGGGGLILNPNLLLVPNLIEPVVSNFTVSPSDIYQQWWLGSNLCKDFDTTYTEIDADVTSGTPITSVVVHWSFPGNSGSGPLANTSGHHWNTAVGGFTYPTFSFVGNQAVVYYLVVTDKAGHTLTTKARHNILHPVTDCGMVLPPFPGF